MYNLGSKPAWQIHISIQPVGYCLEFASHGTADRDQPVAPMSWMQRLKRVFAIDIETCPDCRGTLRVIACIEDPPLIAKILEHVRSREAGEAAEARAPPADSQQVPKLL
jgi:hypothetical protein